MRNADESWESKELIHDLLVLCALLVVCGGHKMQTQPLLYRFYIEALEIDTITFAVTPFIIYYFTKALLQPHCVTLFS